MSFLLMAVLVSSLVFTSCKGGEKKTATTDTPAVKADTAMVAPPMDTTKKMDTAAGKPIVPPAN